MCRYAQIFLHRVSVKIVWKLREQHPSKAPWGYIHANLVGPELAMLDGTTDRALLFRHHQLRCYSEAANFFVSPDETARHGSSNKTLAGGRHLPKDLSRSRLSLLDKVNREGGNEIAAQG